MSRIYKELLIIKRQPNLKTGKDMNRYFSKEDLQMSKKHMKRYLTTLFIREVQIKTTMRTSLVVQWLRIRLPMQGTRVRALVWEDPTCRRATKPMCHNY